MTDEQENKNAPDTEQEAAQDALKEAVTARGTEDETQDTPTMETPQEATESPEKGTANESGQETDGTSDPAIPAAALAIAPVLMAAGGAAAEESQETDEEYETLEVNSLDIVKLGRQGEHLTQQVLIDCTAWLDKLPGCTLLIAAIRPGESTVYLPTVSAAGGVITWNIQDQDTANGGWGRGEVRAMLDGKIKKSVVFRTRVEPSLEGSGSAPATPPDWVQTILDSVGKASADAAAAAASAATAVQQATAAATAAVAAAENTAGLRGWSLTKEADDTVTIDYHQESEG